MPQIATKSRPRRRAGVLEATVDEEVVLLAESQGVYHGLDPIGAEVWRLLDGASTVGELCDRLVDAFDVTPEVCHRDVVALLVDLAGRQLIDVD